MASKIQIVRVCQQCEKEFVARTTVTKYCSHACSQKAYKERQRQNKIAASNTETQRIRLRPLQELQAKEFLTVKEAAQLLSCSVRTVYYQIEQGTIQATNLGERMTRIRRSDIDQLFNRRIERKPETVETLEKEDCYSLEEVRAKYSISDSSLYQLIRKHRITKLKEWRTVYVPKATIHEHLGE